MALGKMLVFKIEKYKSRLPLKYLKYKSNIIF